MDGQVMSWFRIEPKEERPQKLVNVHQYFSLCAALKFIFRCKTS